MPDARTPPLRTVLLLGGTGFVGTNLAAELVRAGHRVIVAGRTAQHFENHPLRSDVALPLADVDAVAALVRNRGVDTVVHLASSMIPSSSPAQYEAEQQAIVRPTVALGRVLAERGVDLLFFSSGGTVYGAVPNGIAREDAPCAPISLYGQAKLLLETELAFLRRTLGLNCLIVRPSNPFGPHQALRGAQGLVSVILGKMADNRPLEIWGDGTGVRDYIYIDDLVSSVRGLIEGEVRNTVVNLGSGTGHSLLEVVGTVEAVTGRSIERVFRPSRPVDVPRLVLDIGRLRALGLHAARSLEDGVRAYVDRLAAAGV